MEIISPEMFDLALRLGAAALGGALIGLDRELVGKPLGLRTMILVASGSAMFAIIAEVVDPAGSSGDLGRVLQGAIAGIGVLGVGAFWHDQNRLRLATTGASVWAAGAIGIACGLGLFALAGLATLLTLFVLTGIGVVERALKARRARQATSEQDSGGGEDDTGSRPGHPGV